MPWPREAAASKTTSTELIRRRVRLMVEISARPGVYRRGLEKAAERLTPEEAAVLADLEFHGLNVVQLRDVLRGAHVLVDDASLYERWLFPKASHQRISSHHHEIDKQKYPDYGMRGPVLREKLHGRTAHGTWVQLEKTPAAFGKRKLPSWNDVVHLADYVMYRLTRSNIGPWGRWARPRSGRCTSLPTSGPGFRCPEKSATSSPASSHGWRRVMM